MMGFSRRSLRKAALGLLAAVFVSVGLVPLAASAQQAAPPAETRTDAPAKGNGTPAVQTPAGQAPSGQAPSGQAPAVAQPAAGQAPAAPANGAATHAPANGAAAPAPEAAAPPPAAPPPPPPPDPAIQAAREKMDAGRSALDALAASIAIEGLRSTDLDGLRERLDPVRRELMQRSDELAPRLTDAKTRLAGLGAKPAEGAPAEDPNIAADRIRVQALVKDLEGLVSQNRALLDRANQVSDTISTRRRALFTGQLFERSYSIFNPDLWTSAIASIGGEMKGLQLLLNDWWAYANNRHGILTLSGILAGAIAILAAFRAAGAFVNARFGARRKTEDEEIPRRRLAREALKVALTGSLVWPLAAVAVTTFLGSFDVVPVRAVEIMRGLVVAIFIQSIGQGITRAVLAPGEGWRRLLRISDTSANLTYRYLSLSIWTLSITAFLNAVHKTLFAPLSLTVATSAIMALFIGSFVARLLIHLARDGKEEADAPGAPAAEADTGGGGGQSVRFFTWLALALLVGALALGYVSFAAFVVARMVVAAVVLGALYILYAWIDTTLSEGLAADTPRARSLSRTLGLKQNNIELIGTLLAGVLKVLLFLLAGLFIAGSWGTSTADVMDTVERASFGIQIGNVNVTLWSVLTAIVTLIIGVALARGLQGWLTRKVLPTTGLEPSLQSSIATIVGYIGVILAIMIPMGQLGLNLENIALVAGALSVGIGFGLQSIVSNFVSGLILLAERPIRVGDTINVKGEEGYVRRISVRSTEIETFDRAAVIVPNSDLITGMVKNFTHANTTGRIIVPLNVSLDADPEEVRDILVSCACDHPQVMQSPPPRVFLVKFTDVGLGFELRCVVANVDYSLTVKSDLHFSILSRFRKAGIGLVAQPWAALARAPVDMVPPPAPAPVLPVEPPPAEEPPQEARQEAPSSRPAVARPSVTRTG